MGTKNREKPFIKCPEDGKVILASQCLKCKKLFQIQRISNKDMADMAIIECQAGKTTSSDPKNM